MSTDPLREFYATLPNGEERADFELLVDMTVSSLKLVYQHEHKTAEKLVAEYLSTFANKDWCNRNDSNHSSVEYMHQLSGAGLAEVIHYDVHWKGPWDRTVFLNWRKQSFETGTDVNPHTVSDTFEKPKPKKSWIKW